MFHVACSFTLLKPEPSGPARLPGLQQVRAAIAPFLIISSRTKPVWPLAGL
jgi:hypothetical protein